MNDEQLRDQLEGLFSGLADSAQELVKQPQESEPASPEAQVGKDDPLMGLLATGHGQDEQVQWDALPRPVAPAAPSSVTTPREAVPRRRVNWLLIIWVVLGTIGMAAIVLMAYRQDNSLASTEQPAAEQPAGTAEQPSFVLPPTSTPTPSLTPLPAPMVPSKSTGTLGTPPSETPPPADVLITRTPTPLNTATAAGKSLRATAKAKRVAKATPPAENQAVALITAGPPDVATATPTPTPTYVIITSTPTPVDIATAVANSLRMTAEAERVGTATPLPPNWVTPIVVTSTPTPENAATAEYLEAVALTTGTPKSLPANAVTATPTPIFVLLDGEIPNLASGPAPTATPRRFIPPELVGKIAFLSDRAHHANAGTELAEGEVAFPLGKKPLVYVIDPDGSNLALLSDRWPYDLAKERDAFASDQRYRVFVKDAVHWEDGRRKLLPALYFLDFLYGVEEQITHFGGGIAYEPAWSPTSDQITFVSNDSGNDEIWVINRDGGGALQLTRDQWNWWDKHPSWSPDGSKIVFWSNRTGNRQIWVMDADGSNLHSLSRTGFNDWDPVWIKYTDPPPAPGE